MNVWTWAGASTQQERLIFVGLAVPFMLLVPLFLLAHGYLWNASEDVSNALLVYLMKLAPFIYLLAGIIVLRLDGVKSALQHRALWAMAIVMILGLVAPFLVGMRPSVFYYAADAIGMLATFAYVLVTFELLRRLPGLRHIIFKVMIAGSVIASLVILVLYVWSRGNKVSIPPDIHYGIALGLLLYLASLAEKFRFKAAPMVIMAGVGASQFRMNMLVTVISILASWFWVVALNRGRHFHWRVLETVLLITIMVVPFSSAISETLGRSGLVIWNPLDAIAAFLRNNFQIIGEIDDKDLAGQALDQRYVETFLVFQEVMRQPLSFLTGQGFGATFANTASAIATGDAREHSVHNSIAALLLRNGIVGVAIFLVPAIFAIRTAFRRERALFVSSVALLAIYLACMADQYVYWGGFFGIAIAVWFHAWRHSPDDLSESA